MREEEIGRSYVDLADDRKFILSLQNTLFYTLVQVPMYVLVSLSLAMLLNKAIRGAGNPTYSNEAPFEAAKLDGANTWTMFWRIAMPLTRPAIVVTLIFELQAAWTDLMGPLIYLRDSDKFTLPRGLKARVDQWGSAATGSGRSSSPRASSPPCR